MSVEFSELERYLKKYFGYDTFKNGQKETIESILSKCDTLAIMPTGGGKSLCYQLPSLMLDGTVIVISPLIALMKDQVDTLTKNKIPATFINSTIPLTEINERIKNAVEGRYKLLYIAPERLESTRFIDSLNHIRISFLAVDEAHCISEWGHDFRPAYLSIVRTIESIVRPPLIALTATATPEVQEDIIKSLKMKNPGKFIRGFDRPNLTYHTIEESNKTLAISKIIKDTGEGSTIIYAGSRKRTEAFAKELNQTNIPAKAYHAGQEDNYRKFIQEGFFEDKFPVIVATNAFGMGIDKADVRNVIHVDFTQTLEGYYQEAGRAGRDGKPAGCYLLYQYSDRKLMEFFINSAHPNKNDVIKIYNSLFDNNKISIGSKPSAPVYFDEMLAANTLSLPAVAVNSVLNLLENQGIIMRGSTQGMASLKFTTSRERLSEYLNAASGNRRDIMEALLRSVSSSAFSKMTDLDINHLSSKFMISVEDVIKALRSFEFAGMLKYIPPGTPRGIVIKQERARPGNIGIDFDEIDRRRERAFRKLDIVVNYATTNECKRNFILNYFRENDIRGICGKCSGCKGTNRQANYTFNENHLKALIKLIAEINGRFGKIIVADILKGSTNSKTERFYLTKLKSFGALKTLKANEIKDLVENALKAGYLTTSTGTYPTLSLGEKSMIYIYANRTMGEPDLPVFPGNEKMLKALTKLRDDLAEENMIVQRAITSDKTLRLIAERAPTTIDELGKIQGVSSLFKIRFGKVFLETINGILTSEARLKKLKELPENSKRLINALNGGNDFKSACKNLGLSPADAAGFIQSAIECGMPPFRNSIVSDEDYGIISKAVKTNPKSTLKQIRETTGSELDLPVLRIAVAFAREESGGKN